MTIREKGIQGFSNRIGEGPGMDIPPELFAWLQQLQLRFPKVDTYEPTIDLANIATVSYSTQTFTVEGLNINDIITVNPPVLTAGLYLISYRVSAANTLSLTFYNSTGGGIDEASAVYKIVSIRV